MSVFVEGVESRLEAPDASATNFNLRLCAEADVNTRQSHVPMYRICIVLFLPMSTCRHHILPYPINCFLASHRAALCRSVHSETQENFTRPEQGNDSQVSRDKAREDGKPQTGCCCCGGRDCSIRQYEG